MRIGRWIVAAAALFGAVASAQGPVAKVPPLTPAPSLSQSAPRPFPASPSALTPTDLDAWLDGFLPQALHAADIAGAVVTGVRDGQVLAARGYGYADIARRRPVDPARTLFRPGSVSKLVTWTAVMQQVEAGRLDLDRDVNASLDFRIPPRNGQPVTLRQILTHTAGFEEAARNLIVYDPRGLQPLGAYLKRWVPRRIYDAGTTPAYSNWATTLAGYIVQRVSGMPFDDYVERRIFAPLGMRTATFRQPLPRALAPLMATGYPRASEPARPFEMVVAAPAGSLSASGLDMARFMISHLENGRGVLSSATAATMHDSPTGRVDPRSLIPPLNRMELGFFETNINGREVIGHLGDTNEFHTSLHLFMAERVGLYVSFNSAGRDGAAHQLRTQLFQGFADRYFPATARDGRVDPRTARDHARMMTGLWQNSRHSESNFVNILTLVGQSAVRVGDDGSLVIPALKGAGGAVQRWDEIAPFVWRERGGHERVAAQVADGRVVRWSFDLVAPFMVFDRVPAWRSAAWIKPAFYAALGVLLLTVLAWPAGWWARRRYKAARGIGGRAAGIRRATRVMALADLVVLGGWMVFVTAVLADGALHAGGADAALWLLQVGGAIAFVGAVGIAGWNAWATWRDGRGWGARAWSVLVLLATLVVLYVAAAFGLLAMTVNY